MASTIAMNLLSIPQSPDFRLGDLKESIFVGAENATKNLKIAGQFDPVKFLFLNLQTIKYLFYFRIIFY
jgi:hypothetical protein